MTRKTLALFCLLIGLNTLLAAQETPTVIIQTDSITNKTATINLALGQVNDSVPFVKNLSYTIGGISVKGNQKFSEAAILVYTGLIVGQKIKLPGDKLTSAIKKLWNSDLFSNLDVYVTGLDAKGIVNIDFVVKELPKASSVTYKGVKKSKGEDLRDDTKLMPGAMLTENLITTSKNYIEKKYREKGYLNAKVVILTKPDSTKADQEKVLVNIDKGTKIKIKNVRFHGNKAFSTNHLRKLLKKTKQKNPLHIFSPSKYIQEKYSTDLENIVSTYSEKGYRDAQIIKDSISWNKDNTINLDITLTEGNRYYFGDIRFLGNTVYTDDQLRGFLKLNKGMVYNGTLLKKRISGDGKPDSEDLSSVYLNNGYLFSNVTPVETRVTKDSIDIEVRIREDKPAYIKKVTVVGNDRTNDHVIFRDIRTLPGNLFSKQDIIRTIREIGQLGFFDAEKINPDVQPNYIDKTVDIEYSVAEKGSSQIELQGGFGGNTFIGTLGLSFNNFSIKNLFNKKEYRPLPMGDGQSLSLRLQTSRFFNTYSFSFTEPWLGGKSPKSLSFSVFSSSQFRADFTSNRVNKDQKLQITGATVGLGQRLKWPDDFFQLSTSISFQQFKLNNFPVSTFNFSNGTSNNLALGINFGRNNTRINPVFPTGGSDFNLGFKFTLPYSSFNKKDYTNATQEEKLRWLEYYKAAFKAKWYSSLAGSADHQFVLMSNVEFGFLGAYNHTIGDSPFERFYVGGDGLASGQFDGRETVGLRGYPNSSLSTSFGGTVYNKFSFELRYPLTLKPSASIYGLTFLEGGNSYDGFINYNPFELKRSYGFGIRIFMPAFGLLGIDFGNGLDNIPGTNIKSGWQTHFIIGQQF
ncbi:MAG: outer membrane protein assembly factor BamA [Flavobacteriales bacterium CG03_land_8_20_14_0_80_35_15]|nr:outer membrane protein assembly factor BamA [Zetaproteobacteria bacterium]OIO11119.1 MAG: outer membrane protein assembly factor BamA [Flavobacteriaceae bacterium CG1_02_35_72]PIV17592.1 MAG: outer membrane protein assembly factor BamA [Flavobacteriales bacterium CG03_land_8_20_14_0_80_35_15]PIX06201.1 MAG: outer membrane protein assembly factor BamA [Flavobacteriales bacterium CG_4_8_14_3_um_filter_35_10]PJA06291.1 MAG: outer membrane protein assembly factor BamA [Flavobacteriales bacterium